MAEINSSSSNSGDETQNSGTCIMVDLSEEEKQMEEKFKHRFTDEDEEFQKTLAAEAPTPPFVYPWDARPPRQRGNWNQNQRNRRDNNRDGNQSWRNRDDRWNRHDNQGGSSNSYRDREDRRSSYDRPNYHRERDNRRNNY